MGMVTSWAGSQSGRDCGTRIAAGRGNPPPSRWAPGRARDPARAAAPRARWACWVPAGPGAFLARFLRAGRELAAVWASRGDRWRRRESAGRGSRSGHRIPGRKCRQPACPAESSHGRIVGGCRGQKRCPRCSPRPRQAGEEREPSRVLWTAKRRQIRLPRELVREVSLLLARVPSALGFAFTPSRPNGPV